MTRVWVYLSVTALVAAGAAATIAVRSGAPDPEVAVSPVTTVTVHPVQATTSKTPGRSTPVARPRVQTPTVSPSPARDGSVVGTRSEAAPITPAPSTQTAQADPPTTTPVAAQPSPTPTPAIDPVASPAPPASTPAEAPSAPKAAANQTIVIKKDSVIGIKLDRAIEGDTARVDDKIAAKVSRDVVVDGVTAIPAGTRLEGVITHIEHSAPGTKGKIGLRFTTLVQADNTKVSMQTDVIFREGEPLIETTPAFNTTSAFGAVVTDRMQALRGQTAARGTPTPMRYRDARLPEGSLLTVQLTAPLSLTIHRETP